MPLPVTMARNSQVRLSSSTLLGIFDCTKLTMFADPGVVVSPKISDPWTVDKVLGTIHPEAPKAESSSPLPFFHVLERLKTGKREGWRRFGITR